MEIQQLTSGQYATVYNLISLAIASLFFTGLYLIISQKRVLPRYRNALVVSATVCFIATYHYVRIFDNFKESYDSSAQGGQGVYNLTNIAFNEGYRYVDWFLTVPLLLVETIAVLALTRAAAKPLLTKLVIASGLMIA
ncbi:MAG: bacteriorhodopsin, partial [Frankiales bacterium]|nr:bacteriorhodopsin [Frankiales bacterium]